MCELRKGFLEVESTPGEDAETTTKILEQYANPQWQGLRGLTLTLKEVLLCVKCSEIAFHATEKLFLKGRVNQYGKHHCYFFKETATRTPTFINHCLTSQNLSTLRQDPQPAKRLCLTEGFEDG